MKLENKQMNMGINTKYPALQKENVEISKVLMVFLKGHGTHGYSRAKLQPSEPERWSFFRSRFEVKKVIRLIQGASCRYPELCFLLKRGLLFKQMLKIDRKSDDARKTLHGG